MNHHVQIAGRSTLRARLTFALHAQTRAGFDTRWYLHLHLLLAFNATGATTLRTRILHDASGATASLTGARYGKEPLLVAHLTRAGAVAACFRLRPWRSAVAFASFASLQPGNTQLCGH